MRYLASDNNAGVHPDILAALAAANQGHAVGYGDDPWTTRMEAAFAASFGPEARVYPVLTGTGANVLSLSALLQPYEAVICARTAHLWNDECGAPERFLGAKLMPVDAPDGRLKVSDLAPLLAGRNDEHKVQPRIVSITQATELGSVYSLAEIRELAGFAHANGLLLHMDGARLANAAVSLGCSLAELVRGVDVLSFGATKNGLLCGEAVLFLTPGLDARFKFLRKQGMQLLSKMRFVSAQLASYLETGLWQANAAHANAMARLLAESVADRVEIVFPVETNAVFARLPQALIKPLQDHRYFYVWDEQASIVRWMTSFDTQPEDITDFAAALGRLMSEHSSERNHL